MASGPENRFIQAVHSKLPATVYRMKNHNPYNSGIADCWYSGRAGDLWIEYKWATIPKRDSTVVDMAGGKNPPISALQSNWLVGRDEEGRNVGAIIGTPSGGIWLPKTTFLLPLTAKEMQARVMSKSDLAKLITALTEP